MARIERGEGEKHTWVTQIENGSGTEEKGMTKLKDLCFRLDSEDFLVRVFKSRRMAQ